MKQRYVSDEMPSVGGEGGRGLGVRTKKRSRRKSGIREEQRVGR